MERITLQSNIEELNKLYDWLETRLNEKVDEKTKGRILLVAQELATNSIIHGNQLDKAKTVDVTLEYDEDDIALILSDEGSGTYTLPTLEESMNMDFLEEGGRGLKLAVQLTKSIKKEENTLIMTFNIKE